MKKTFLYIIMCTALATTVAQAAETVTGRYGKDFLLKMSLSAAENPGRDREVILTPVLRAIESDDSLVMPTVVVAGRNQYYSHLRNHDLPADVRLVEAGSKTEVELTFNAPWQEWMDYSKLDLRREVACCAQSPVLQDPRPVALLDYRPRPVMPPVEYIALTGDDTVEMEAEGKAFIDFVVNRTELKPDYRGNRAEIDKIIASIDRVANDPDAIITRVTIKGYASPEGSWSNNVRLAMGRTNTLKEYVRQHYNFDPAIMSTDYEPEDWAGLRAYVDTMTTLPHREEILAIIDDKSLEPDPRNAAIQTRYPAEYARLLADIYPALRHSDYTVRYSIKTSIDVDHLKEVFRQDPRRLRPVDFYLIANTYPTGSDEYNEIMLSAASVYPNDEQAAVNAANVALSNGDIETARAYAMRAGLTPEAIYTRANIAARQGDLEGALSLMQQAAEQGMPQAQAQADAIKTIIDREPVTYF